MTLSVCDPAEANKNGRQNSLRVCQIKFYAKNLVWSLNDAINIQLDLGIKKFPMHGRRSARRTTDKVR